MLQRFLALSAFTCRTDLTDGSIMRRRLLLRVLVLTWCLAGAVAAVMGLIQFFDFSFKGLSSEHLAEVIAHYFVAGVCGLAAVYCHNRSADLMPLPISKNVEIAQRLSNLLGASTSAATYHRDVFRSGRSLHVFDFRKMHLLHAQDLAFSLNQD